MSAGPTPRDRLPLVVGGCLRSGTSLVRRILDAHSRIHCGPEVKFFRDLYGDYFSDPLAHLRFTTSARSLVGEDVLLPVLGGAFVELHERAAAAHGKARWADKCPENVLYLEQWDRLLGQDWLFVQVVRDPADTVASLREAAFALTVPADLEGQVEFYARYVAAGLDRVEQRPGRSYLLSYERLVGDPERELDALMRWTGEQLEPQQLAFNSVAHQRGLEDPKVAMTQHVHADSVGRASSVLTRAELERVREGTQQLRDRTARLLDRT